MVTDLEQRRRAIAAALRAIMAEPLPVREPAPAVTAEPAWLVPESLETLDIDQEWEEEDELVNRDDVIVPPLEVVGTMSRRASLALFGHV